MSRFISSNEERQVPSLYVSSHQPADGFLPNLSDNEKRLVSIGVIGIAGWFFFGSKIKRKLKKR